MRVTIVNFSTFGYTEGFSLYNGIRFPAMQQYQSATSNSINLRHLGSTCNISITNFCDNRYWVAMTGGEEIDPIELLFPMLEVVPVTGELRIVVCDIKGVLGYVQGHRLELTHTVEILPTEARAPSCTCRKEIELLTFC